MTEGLHVAGWPLIADLPGIRPTRQRRSQETTVALLEAGAAMLRDCAFDELSIDDLCARVGVTIGAFYGRFESKDAFFSALVSLATTGCLAAIDVAIANDDRTNASLKTVCHDMVAVITEAIRANDGVLRAAMQYKAVQPARWMTVSETGGRIVECATPLLLAQMGSGRRAAKQRTVGFAFQMVFGTLINAVLNKPKLIALDEQEMIDRLALAMFLQLDHEASQTVRPRKAAVHPSSRAR
ncbi:TetR/AcrR family transcriptional regulator [Bradyrhizobium prioriisuperbiae]|uniref:TetR/AcrR family transcriptional regulator n=1 Tax=Bradyrhizobium prioriisuperbiae TaxID=2854389 RepID=UPI0028ED8441|nr:TetR/AcrR family transcriptional regulator [Bradyrhizobium prioritasuperba]